MDSLFFPNYFKGKLVQPMRQNCGGAAKSVKDLVTSWCLFDWLGLLLVDAIHLIIKIVQSKHCTEVGYCVHGMSWFSADVPIAKVALLFFSQVNIAAM